MTCENFMRYSSAFKFWCAEVKAYWDPAAPICSCVSGATLLCNSGAADLCPRPPGFLQRKFAGTGVSPGCCCFPHGFTCSSKSCCHLCIFYICCFLVFE